MDKKVKHDKSKIGYSEIGGVYIDKNLETDFINNHTITVILSMGEPFKIVLKDRISKLYSAAIIQKNVQYRFQSSRTDNVILIHLDPYSETGIRIAHKKTLIQELEIGAFLEVLEEFKAWFESEENNAWIIEHLIERTSAIVAKNNAGSVKIDERILKSIQLIKETDSEKLPIQQVADSVNLSPSYFAYLFKKEMGIAFRKFVLHRKLIKSLYAMHKENKLTETAFLGGFSDQPHFTRTFKRAFGIKPSSTRK